MFDNVFLHGHPGSLCYTKTLRNAKTSISECTSSRNVECDECFNIKNFHTLLTQFCVNKGKHGYLGIFEDGLCDSYEKYPPFQYLNNVSTFHLDVNLSTPTHDATPYLTAVFVRTNHGSWVDIVGELMSESSSNTVPTLFDQIYKHESLIFHTNATLSQIHKSLSYFLWIEQNSKQSDQKLVVNLTLESEFPEAQMLDLSSLEWQGIIPLSTTKPQSCVSLPGVISAGHMNNIQNNGN